MALTIKELLAADTVSQAADKINFNFDQLLLNGGGPAGPQGPQGPPGPIGGRGIRGSQWYEDPNITGGPTDPNSIIFPDLEPNDSYLANDGFVWEYDGTVWVNTGIDLTGPQGIAAQGLWDETGNPELTGQQILYPSTYGSAKGDVRSTFVGGLPSTDPGATLNPNFVIDANVLSTVNSSISSFNIQVPNDATSAIKFFGSTAYSSGYTNDQIQAQSINLQIGDSLVFQDLNNSTAFSAGSDWGYRFETINRSMLIRTGRGFKVETGSTTISGLSEPGDITLRVLATGNVGGKIILDNRELTNSSYLEVGGNLSTFSGNTLAGGIFSESLYNWHGVSDKFTVYAKGSADAITLDASTDGSIVLHADNNIYLKTNGSPSVSSIYIGDPDPIGSGNTTGFIDALAFGAITFRRTSISTAGILVETGNFWNYLNDESDHITLLAEQQVNIKARDLSAITAGAQAGDYNPTNPITGAATSGTPSDGNIEITVHGGETADQGGKIINRLKPTYPSSTGEGEFIVLNSTRNNNTTANDGDMNSIKVETNKRGRVTIGQWEEGDSSVESSAGVPSMDGMALYVNSTVDPNISGTSSSYSKVYPIIKIGKNPRAGDVYNLQYLPTQAKDGGYYGGGAHIVGPYGSNEDQKLTPGAPAVQNVYGREPWGALHLRGGTKYTTAKGTGGGDGIYAPGAVWLYTPNNTCDPPFLLDPTENSIRLWGTRTTQVRRTVTPEVNPGITQGGTTIGLNMLAETAIQPPSSGVTAQRTVGAGQDTVVGRVGLYGKASIDDFPDTFNQSPSNSADTTTTSGTWIADAGAGTNRSINNPADNTYAGVNVGDEYRSRQTFKVFGEYVGDHFSSQFGGDYFGPTFQNEQFLSGAQDNTGYCSQHYTTGNFQDQYVRSGQTDPMAAGVTITYRYSYSWQKVGRVVTFSGQVELASTTGVAFNQDSTDLLILPQGFAGVNDAYGRRLQLRMPLPTQLNQGGQSKNRGGYIATGGGGDGLKGAYPGSMNGICRGLFNGDDADTPAFKSAAGNAFPALVGTAWDGEVGGGTVEHGSETQIYYNAGALASGTSNQTAYMWLQLDGMSPFHGKKWEADVFGEVENYPRPHWNDAGQQFITTPTVWIFNTKYKFTGSYEIAIQATPTGT